MFKRRSKLKTTPDLQVINGGKEAPPTPPHTEQPLLEAQRVEGGENLRTQISERLTTSGISQATLVEQIGISTTTVSQWLGGKYEGDNQAVASKMQAWVEENPQFAVPPSVKVPVFVKTQTAEHIQAALTYAHLLGDLAIIHARAGMGKTTTAAHTASGESGCWVITMAPSFTLDFASDDYAWAVKNWRKAVARLIRGIREYMVAEKEGVEKVKKVMKDWDVDAAVNPPTPPETPPLTARLLTASSRLYQRHLPNKRRKS